MPHPYEQTTLPTGLAKRMVENRGGEAVERHGMLEVSRNGEFLRAVPILDDGVKYLSLCAAFVQHGFRR